MKMKCAGDKHVRCLFLAEIQMQSNVPYTASGVSYARALTSIPNPVTHVDELTGTSTTTGE
jgi:hypothetical protein